MDIDRISYIFGSFARRRQSQQEPPTLNKRHERSRSSPLQTVVKRTMFQSPRAKSVIGASFEDTATFKYKCPMCKNGFIEPRVLPCLHTFCLRCLEELERNHFAAWRDDQSNGSKSQKLNGSSDHVTRAAVCCPSCGVRSELPPGGVGHLPPNYPVQHQMVLAFLNSRSTHLLCDLCPNDVTAVSRCMECAISFCSRCEQDHVRTKERHEVLSLDKARDKGITKIRRQIMCMSHPDVELTVFCSSCYQVVCRECVAQGHRNHVCDSVTKVAKSHMVSLQMAADKAKALVEKSALDTSALSATSKRVEADCNRIQSEIENFIDDYVKAIEDHKQALLEQIKRIRDEKMAQIIQEKLRLQKRIRDARDIAYFLDDLLHDGSDIEVLSFIKPVIEKIEACDNLEPGPELKYSDSVQFLPEEAVKDTSNVFSIYGVLTTQSVSPEHCRIDLNDVQNLRVGKKVSVTLETRDNKERPVERGGEYVTAELRHRDVGGISRSLNVHVTDKRDGTYAISFTPEVPGKLALLIKVKGDHIQGSPFPVTVRSLKPHKGTFHCCSFCSSGGNKETSCGCGGKMPGGYKGCGHGHEGHPGRRHWSCCGNVVEHSECGKTRSSSQYQFSL